MYKFVIAILSMFLLCNCAGTRTVDLTKDSKNAAGLVHIDNKWGATAVFIDNEFVGSTPLAVSLPLGEHRIVMNYGGKIVHDTTLVITDDYERNGDAAIMGGIIGSFIGGWLMSLVGLEGSSKIWQFITAVIGACVLLFVVSLFKRK